MSRISHCFTQLKSADKKALIPYITAGDPSPGHTVALMHTLVEAGADIIELGVPFSDPMADGPVIQLACERALAHGTSLTQVLAMVAEFRQTNQDTPVVLMGYLNPIERMGYARFIDGAKTAGVDGVLVVDLPPEEAPTITEPLKAAQIDPVFLIAPTTVGARMDAIAANSGGYVYYVSLKGVTGSAELDVASVASKVEEIRRHTSLPVGVGFGIKNPQTAEQVAAVSDGVVVGSALVDLIAAFDGDEQAMHQRVHRFVSSLRQAVA